jgi:hypothetical protein
MSYSWAERLKRKNEKNDNRLDSKFDGIIDIEVNEVFKKNKLLSFSNVEGKNDDIPDVKNDFDKNNQEDEEFMYNENIIIDIYEQPIHQQPIIYQMLLRNDETIRKSLLELTIPSYSILSLSKHLVNFSMHPKKKMYDDGDKLIQGHVVTKGALARKMNHFFQKHNITQLARNELLNLLNNAFGDKVNLPIRKLNDQQKNRKKSLFQYGHEMKALENNIIMSKYDSDDSDESSDNLVHVLKEKMSLSFQKKSSSSLSSSSLSSPSSKSYSSHLLNENNAVSLVESYDTKVSRFVQFDQCFNDCFVYAGDNKEFFICPICNEIRFRPCCRSLCKGRGRFDCSHLKDNDGVAYKQLFYRPILLLITDLIQTGHFLTALNYKRISHLKDEFQEKSYTDFMDGEIAIKHLQSMDENFVQWKIKNRDNCDDAISVPLLLSEFYDGGQLFKSFASNFWVLLTQILNLPPTYRGKLGIGMFVQAIYAGKHKNAEAFLFIDNFCEELRELYYGIEMTISGVLYFIQARLVLHTLDTRAAEAVLSLQSTSGSRAGCPICGSITGVHTGNKCCYIGHRHMLPWNHYLRFLGQSGRCCPTDFYHPTKKTQDLWLNEAFLKQTKESVSILDNAIVTKFESKVRLEEVKIRKERSQLNLSVKQIELASRKQVWLKEKNKLEFDFCLPCDADVVAHQKLKDFLFRSGELYHWSHKEPDFEFGDKIMNESKGLRKYLFYRHFDLRKFHPHKRVSYDQHLQDAEKARTLNAKKKCKKTLHINGIQNIWYFDRLPYANIAEQFTWPFVHAITGVVKLLSAILMGAVINEKKSSKQNEKRGSTIEEEQDDDDDEYYEENDDGYEDDDEADQVPEKKSRILSKSEKNKIFNSYRLLGSPHVATKNDMNRCHQWLQCVLLPPGLDDDSYYMKGFMLHEDGKLGYMKMNQRLKLISCFWELIIFSLTDLKDQYKLFYRMIGNDISKLLSFHFDKLKLDQIHDDILETICLFEGLFPSKHCTFQLHEIVDLVDFIPLFGPPMGISEFPGERAIGKMISRKLKSNTGGLSFEKTIMDNQINFELQTMKSFYNEPIHCSNTASSKNKPANNSLNCKYDSKTGILLYNSIPFSICVPEVYYGKTKVYIPFSEYEWDYLMATMIYELKKEFKSDHALCLQNSAIYRIHSLRLEMFPKLSSFQWLQYIVSNGDEINGMTVEEFDVANALLQFKPIFHEKAHIYGILFNSRGNWLRGLKEPKSVGYGVQIPSFIEGTNEEDYFLNSFTDPKSYGSWCRFEGTVDESKQGKHYYGQINTFFQINIGDPSVDGLVIASITARKDNIFPKSSLHYIKGSGSLDKNTLFVSTTDIYPTRIATVPFNSDNKAISVERQNISTKFSTSNTSNFSSIYMITLNPDKIFLFPKYRHYKTYQLSN